MEYLADTPGSSFKIMYQRSKGRSNLLSGYADVDWGNSCSRRSTSGTLMLYNKAPTMWKSKMQKTTALSTAEAEYYSASTAGTEILYLRAVLERLGIAQKAPTPVYEDNTACIEWGNSVIGGRERAKHIDIRKHFAHEVIKRSRPRHRWQTSTPWDSACHSSKPVSTASSERTRTSSLNGPLSSREGRFATATRVESRRPLRGVFRRLNGKPRPEPDIDLYHGHPSPETRIWDRGSGPVVDGSGPMQDFAVGSLALDTSFYSERNRMKRGREE
jgi:hypothetical protein